MSSLVEVKQFFKYVKAIRDRELIRIPLLITERCDSRCKTCHIWAKKSAMDMPINMIENVLNDAPNAIITLLGGEPTLHPDIEDILRLFKERKRFYKMVCNGMSPDHLEFLVNKYNIPDLTLSCDGTKEAYKQARGVDNFDNIVSLVKKLRDKTRLSLGYTISYWNSREELLKMQKLCKDYGVALVVTIYEEVKYFYTTAPRMKEIYKADDLARFPHNRNLRLYNKWVNGKIKMPCHYIKYACQIETDGDVHACGRKFDLLGNLNTQSLSEIWNSPQTKMIQNELIHCNDCWSICREIDVVLNIILPKFVIAKL
jgi:MoaA/NifB/PqqE/SkfB family radical SAM enzyme